MHTIMASHAGFCAGVKRAFKIAEEMAGQPSKWYTWGPLVHNQSVVEYFARQGISAVEDIDEISEPAGLIIRSHGVAPEIIQEAENCGLQVRDATCPLVKRVHEIVQVLADQGYEIVIYGNPEHPEVKGIQGWCGGQAAVVSGLDDIKTLNHSHRMGIVSQTTRDEKEYFEVVKSLLGRTEELKVFNTICSATQLRQNSALELCQQVDLMIVVGGEFSSNTTTLYKECLNTGVRTYLVQNAGDINPHWLEGVKMAGITAGASTPDWIIKEVLCRMTEYEEKDIQQEDIQQEVQDQIEEQTQEPVQEPVFEPQQEEPGSNEQPAEEANEESFARMEAEMAEYETPGRGDVIKGTIVQVLDDEVMVDVGGKSEGVVPLRELSLATVDSARDLVQVGEEIEVMILKWDDDGTILLSKKRVDSKKVLDELEEVFEKGDTVQGTVKDIVKGGLIVDVGVVGFLPASHVEDGYVKNLEEYKD